MSEAGKENRRWINKEFLKWFTVTRIISSIGKHLLMGLVGMPRPLAFLLSELLTMFVAYDYLPDPKWSFRKYATSLASLLIGGQLTWYVAIPYLETFLPPALAYGIPLISYGVLVCFTFRYSIQNKSTLKNS